MLLSIKRPGWIAGLLYAVTVPLSLGSLHAQKVDGSDLFSSHCSGCHGSDGRGGEHAPNIATTPAIQHLSDSGLTALVEKGVAGAGMPGFAWIGHEKIVTIVAYLRGLQGRGSTVEIPGSPANGESLFRGKAKCAECHMVNGSGGFIASDLTFYGADASPSQIRAVILDPARSLPAQNQTVTLTTRTGHTYSGLKRLEDNFSMTLQSTDGTFYYLHKDSAAKVEKGTVSLMPTNYGAVLNVSEVDDLVSYLIHSGIDAAGRSERKGPKSDDDEE